MRQVAVLLLTSAPLYKSSRMCAAPSLMDVREPRPPGWTHLLHMGDSLAVLNPAAKRQTELCQQTMRTDGAKGV